MSGNQIGRCSACGSEEIWRDDANDCPDPFHVDKAILPATMVTVREALTSEDEIAHGEAWSETRGGLGVCAYCDHEWPCRTQQAIDRLLAKLA